MSELNDRIADSERVTAYLHSLQQGGGTPPVIPPVEPPVTPPVQPPVSGGPGTLNYAVPWAYTTEYLRTSGFGQDTTLVIGFMIPTNAPAGQKGRASASEYGGGSVERDACISSVPGSFTDGVVDSTTHNPSPLFWLTVGQNVVAGVTYYMNIRNSKPSSGGGNTEMSCQVTITS